MVASLKQNLSLLKDELRRNNALRIRRSNTHRWGVFAGAEIKKFDLLEEAPYFAIPNEQVRSNDECDRYTYWLSADSKLIGMGYAGLYNHSSNPNACYEIDYINDVIRHYALRDIDVNEEVVIDYGEENTKRFELTNN